MPPAGVKKGTKRARQYEHIKDSLKEQGAPRTRPRRSPRARSTRSAHVTASRRRPRRPRREDPLSSGERGGRRSGTRRAKGRTRDQLYAEAQHKNIKGRSRMNKAQLERAVGR